MNSGNVLSDAGHDKGRFANLIEKIMFAILLIIPFGLVAGKSMIDYIALKSIKYWLMLAVLCIGVLAVCAATAIWLQKKEKTNPFVICLGLYVVSFILRAVTCYFMQVEPISDFEQCYNYALGMSSSADYLARFPYLGAEALTLKAFFRFFPKTLYSMQCLNAAVTSCIPVILYWTVRKMTEREDAAFMSGAFYAFYPGMIVYTVVPSCEHFSQLFMALTLMLFVYAKSADPRGRGCWLLYAGCGVSLGLMYVYKELFIIVMPAILMASFCYEVIPAAAQLKNQFKTVLRKIVRIIGWNLMIMFLALAVHSVCVRAIQIELKGYVEKRNSSIAATLYEGLALQGRGTWNPEVKETVARVYQETESNSERNRILMQKLIDDYRDDPFELIVVQKEKFYRDWCHVGEYYYITNEGKNETVLGDLLFRKLEGCFQLVLSTIIALGLMIQLCRNKRHGEGQGFFVVVGIIFLFMIALTLMEAQGRYKSSIMPLIFILESLMLTNITDTGKELVLRSRFYKE